MITRADAEYAKDREALNAVMNAETRHNFQTGPRFSEHGSHTVKVSFYPATKFWIVDTDQSGRQVGEARPLTREEYDRTWSLRL